MKTKGKGLSQLWKRNAVVAAIALFVCAAVYLNWSYEQEAAGKTLGESTLVGKEDPLLGGGADGSSSGWAWAGAEADGSGAFTATGLCSWSGITLLHTRSKVS